MAGTEPQHHPSHSIAIMKPWREIIVPHPDVLKGTFQQSEFAADLTAVHTGKATAEYGDAKAFYELIAQTYK